IRTVGDVKLLARAVDGVDIKDLKGLVDEGKKQVGSGVVAIVGITGEGKAGIVVGVTKDLTERFNAIELVRKGAEALGGKGGGGRIEAGRENDRQAAVAPAAFGGEVLAAHIGQSDVGEQHVDAGAGAELGERLASVRGLLGLVAELADHVDGRHAHDRIVLND